jgi:hypothetical protein
MPSHPGLLRYNRFPPVAHIFGSNNNVTDSRRPYDLIVNLNDLSARRWCNSRFGRYITLRR